MELVSFYSMGNPSHGQETMRNGFQLVSPSEVVNLASISDSF
jgi:hypothetical protein